MLYHLKSWLRKQQLQFSSDMHVSAFMEFADLFCRLHGVQIIFDPNKLVDIGDGQMCNGYFWDGDEDNQPQLVVATGKPQKQWLQTLVHEFAHCTQWAEDSVSWNITYLDDGTDVYTMLHQWMLGQIELDQEEAESCAILSRMHELDCDQRAVQLIKQWKLPIITEHYIQKANAYALFYNYIGQTGKWYGEDQEPYNVADIWKNMPTTWLEDYDDSPATELLDLYYHVYGE